MKQAKTLTATELRRVTDSIATRAHPVRNRNGAIYSILTTKFDFFVATSSIKASTQ